MAFGSVDVLPIYERTKMEVVAVPAIEIVVGLLRLRQACC